MFRLEDLGQSASDVLLVCADRPHLALRWDGALCAALAPRAPDDPRQRFRVEGASAAHRPPETCAPDARRLPQIDEWVGTDDELAVLRDLPLERWVCVRPAALGDPPDHAPLYLGAPCGLPDTWHLYATRSRHSAWEWRRDPDDAAAPPLLLSRAAPFHDMAIVVARYNENLDWLLPYQSALVVYDKGDSEAWRADLRARAPRARLETLPNLGREAHTYLSHAIQEYDALPRRVLWLQGDSLPHNHTLRAALEHATRLLPLQSLALGYLGELPVPFSVLRHFCRREPTGLETFTFPLNDQFQSPLFFDPHIGGMCDRVLQQARAEGWRVVTTPLAVTCRQFMLPQPATEFIPSNFCGLLALDRATLRRWPRGFYESLRAALIARDPQSGMQGYALEKLWLWVFTCQRGGAGG